MEEGRNESEIMNEMRRVMSRDTLYTWDQSTNKGFLEWEMTSTIYGQMGVFFAMLSFLFFGGKFF